MNKKNGPEPSEAIVLRSIRHGETSRIVTLFDREHGKYAVIAKGARRSKGSGNSGTLEPPSLIEAQVYFKKTRSVQTLGHVTLIDGYRAIKSDLSVTAYASVVLQYLYRSFTDGDANEIAFLNAIRALSNFEHAQNPSETIASNIMQDRISERLRLILGSFQLELIEALGFGISLLECPVCHKSDPDIGHYNLLVFDSGGICCTSCKPSGNQAQPLTGETVRILRRLSSNGVSGIKNLRVSKAARDELINILGKYLKYHHHSLGDLTSLAMLDKLENPVII
ncbi:MAG: DNA repair protein RecO [Calditrichaeota bacterium]|jgi:DNA repair protein RecO (recombination protein O)|nr:DNA repair protein RecO [Calditrichota bacterium]MBT7618341.1 DNA repair protein RecO [Calditrichota bacterium]MBT7790677.1 DNA repair protein RecO [Calditrichota bacterium]